MRKRKLSYVTSSLLVIASTATAYGQAPAAVLPAAPTACDFNIGEPFEAPAGVPVQIGHVEMVPGGLVARIVNVAAQPIVAYEARVSTVCGDARVGDAGGPRHVVSITSASNLQWRPGTELLVRFLADVIPADATVDVMGVVLADGSGYGEPKVVNRFRRDVRDHVDGRVGVLALLAEAPVPSTDDELQALIDQIALAMARVPVPGASTSVLSPYMETVAALRRLHGRDMGGTERLGRELQVLRARWQRELDAVSPPPAARSPDR
jgi:hypothetical protein